MRIRRRWMALAVVGMLCVVMLIGLLWRPWQKKEPLLTEDQANEAVLAEYPGEIDGATFLEGSAYRVKLKLATGTYEVAVNAYGEGIIGIERLEVVKPSEQPSPEPTPTPEPEQSPDSGGQTSVSVTAPEAGQLALQEIAGVIQEIELKESKGIRYYLVEMDTADDREAVVQVNAITGAIMSVTWDDEEDKDHDD